MCYISVLLRRDVFEDVLSNYLAKSLCDFENNLAKKELYMIIILSIEVIDNNTVQQILKKNTN